MALIDYYPEQKKVFLSQLFHSIKSEENLSADLKITELIMGLSGQLELLAVDHPWQLPTCLRCQLACPGFEVCDQPHIQWFWSQYKKSQKKRKTAKLFTPYTQRCVETYVASGFDTPFEISHAMGANSAPLLARAKFLYRRTENIPWHEVFPPLSVWRLGRHLKIKKSDLRSYRRASVGESCRKQILTHLQEHDVVFLYKEDVQHMIQSVYAFDAFICAYTGFLKFAGQTEDRLPGFPAEEDWIEIPQEKLTI